MPLEVRGRAGVGLCFDQEDQLGAAGIAVDHGRRVFGFGRDEVDRGGEIVRTAIAIDGECLADAILPELDLGDIDPKLDVLPRQELQDRLFSTHLLAQAVIDILDAAGGRRDGPALIQRPLRLDHRRAKGVDSCLLSCDAVGTLRQAGGFQAGRHFSDAATIFQDRGLGGVEIFGADDVALHQFAPPLHARLREHQRGQRRVELRLDDCQLLRPFARLEIGQCPFGLGKVSQRLVQPRAGRGVIERKQDGTGCDRIAARHLDLGETARLRQGHVDIITFDITEQAIRRRLFTGGKGDQRSEDGDIEDGDLEDGGFDGAHGSLRTWAQSTRLNVESGLL